MALPSRVFVARDVLCPVDPTSTAVLFNDDPALPTTPATNPIVAAPVAVSSHSDAAFAVVSAGVSGAALLLFFVGVGVGNARRRLGVKP